MPSTLLRRVEADPGVLAKRTFTGLALAVGVGASIVFGPSWSPVLLIAALVLAGAWEWAGLVDQRATRRWRSAYVLTIALCMLVAWIAAGTRSTVAVVLWTVALGWWLAALGAVLRFGAGASSSESGAPSPLPKGLVGAAGALCLVPAWLALGQVHVRTDGPWALLSIILLTVAADIGAYFVGRLYGRRRLAPRVSPGKTLEGLLGGLVCTVLLASLLAALGAVPTPPGFVLVAMGVALVSVLGDLTVSLFKRNAGVKHSGRLLPGHGGVLDRIDSFCATAPLWGLWLAYTGRLQG
ncbi:MAG: phosphatidate cytidylyltransferase [Pseudomonadota bacterium]